MPTATVDRQDPARAGQAVYTRGFLSLYDAIVYGFAPAAPSSAPRSSPRKST